MLITRRELLQLGAASAIGLAADFPTYAAPADGENAPFAWLKKRQRIYWYDQYALNEQELAFAKYDPDRIAAELAAISPEIVAVYAANQFSVAYYPSAIWPMHPNLKGRDYFGDVSSRLKAQGQKVIGYINWLESRHPEWYVVPLGGAALKELPLASWAKSDNPDWRVQRVSGGQWRTPCINSPRRAQVVAVTREIIERYHPDGFHLDMFFNSEVCLCEFCRPTLEKMCGTKDITLETIHAHWREFVDWRCACNASLIAELSAILRENGVFAAHNGQNPLFMSPIYGFDKDLVPSLDIYVSEIFSNLQNADLTMHWHRALGKPSCELLTSASPFQAHLAIPLASWQVSAATAKANGCSVLGPCGVGAYPDTTSSKQLLDTVRKGLEFFMEDADLHTDAAPAAKIALVFSWATRKYFREGRLDWSQELDAWARLLIEEHLPFELVIAEDVHGAADLSRYDLVVLPNTSFVSDTFCAALTAYAQAGGRILATGEISLGDERGLPRADFALGELFGIARKGAVEGNFAMEGAVEPEPAWGVFQQVVASGEVLSRQYATDPAGSVAGAMDTYATSPTEWPVAALKAAGAGHALYVAFGLGRYYGAQCLVHARDRMAQYIDRLLPQRQTIVKAPRHLGVTLWRQPSPERTIIHLANRTPLAHDMVRIHEIPPVHDVVVELASPYASPRVTTRQAKATITVNGGTVRVQIDTMNVYAAIVIEKA